MLASLEGFLWILSGTYTAASRAMAAMSSAGLGGQSSPLWCALSMQHMLKQCLSQPLAFAPSCPIGS